jgi:hypothetical protein
LQTLTIITAVFAGMFFTDYGRKMLFNSIAFFLQTKNIKLVVDEFGNRKIRKIFIRLADKMELTLSDVTWKQNYFLDRLSVGISGFILKKNEIKAAANASESQNKFLLLVPKLKAVIKDFSIANVQLHIGNKMHSMNNIYYKSQKDTDFILCKIEDWSGELTIKNAESVIANYEFSAQNNDIKIISNGCYSDFMSDIKIDDVTIECRNITQKCWGNLYLSQQSVNLKTEIYPEQFFDKLTSPILIDNLKDLIGYSNINCDFANGLICRVGTIFKRDKTQVGNLDCFYEKDRMKFSGDISWIKIFNFNLLKLDGEVDEKKAIKLNLFGECFEINSNIKIDDRVSIDMVELRSPKGSVKSTKPFFINEECSFDFNFNQLDFWNKIASIYGNGSGSFTYKNGAIFGKGNFPELVIDKKKISSLKFSIAENNLQATIKSAEMFGIKLNNFDFKSSNHHFDLQSKINDSGILKASGEITELFKKISLKNGKIEFPNNKIELEDCIFDAISNVYRVNCSLSNKKNVGKAKINCDNQAITCNFSSFPLDKFMVIFNRNIPSCRLNGDLKLKTENGNFIGNGKLSLLSFVAHKRHLEIDLKSLHNGVKISANVNHQKDFIKVSALVPIVLKSDGSIIKNLNSNQLNCNIIANTSLKKIIELSDNSDLRGNLICDIHLGGSFTNPTILGKAELRKAYIAIKNILLQNGTISLTGNGGNIISVSHGEFIDHKKRKAIISGTGKLFFDGFVPNIHTNIQLQFNNFALFDSENFKIAINGNGLMNGPINDMTISGNIVVPKCEIQYLATEEEKLNIVFENDPYLCSDKKLTKKVDFFKYNISMQCNNIIFIGKIFKIHLRGSLLLSNYLDSGTLIGELNLIGGKLNLFGKRLKFTEGKVTFLKEFPYDPKISFKCQRNFEDINVGLEIKNSPNKGTSLNLYSIPSYTQDVILSKMLFEKEMKYLTVGEAAQLANVIANFNQRGYIFSVLNTFQNIGVIDNISFASANDNQSSALYSNHQSSSTKNNVSVSAGKYINDNVYISVNKKDEGASFDIDFSVTPRVSIKANTMGEAGISWKYRY